MAHDEICVVCAEPESDPMALQVCANCVGVFHLNPQQGPGKDCGIVGLGEEQNPTLLFVCNKCLHAGTAAATDSPATVPTNVSSTQRAVRAIRRPGSRRFRRIGGATSAGQD